MTTTLTATAQRTSVVVPVGTDPVSLAVLVAAHQAGLDRTEWASKSLIVPTVKALDMGGNDYTDRDGIGYHACKSLLDNDVRQQMQAYCDFYESEQVARGKYRTK